MVVNGNCTWCYGAGEYFNCECEQEEEGMYLCKDSTSCGFTLCIECDSYDDTESVGC